MPQPIVQFKAGKCEVDETTKPHKVKPISTPGFIYLYVEEDLTHFCWRPRSHPIDDEDSDAIQDLMLFPGDARFEPWNAGSDHSRATNGRIYCLSFDSSNNKHFFWLQAKNQHPDDKPDHWSERDLSLGHIVNEILKGEDVDASQIYGVRGAGGRDDDDDDAEMQDADDDGPAAGGAGAGPTGGNNGQEGEGSRRGGEDGARAGNTRSAAAGQSSQEAASAAVANLLQSLQGNSALGGQSQGQQSPQGKLFTTLPELLQPTATLPVVQAADNDTLNGFLSLLPPQLLLLAQEADDIGSVDPNPETAQAALQALTIAQKKDIVSKVLRSPQFSQSLTSLTAALRDGGLPTISDALKIQVENSGLIRHGAVPLGGGEAVEAFLNGIKATVEKEQKQGKGDQMETD